jgi:predicted metalloendopeptidase
LAISFPSFGLSQERPSGIDSTGFDRNVRIQDDLFRSVMAWLDKTEIPSDRSNYGSSRPWPTKRKNESTS